MTRAAYRPRCACLRFMVLWPSLDQPGVREQPELNDRPLSRESPRRRC